MKLKKRDKLEQINYLLYLLRMLYLLIIDIISIFFLQIENFRKYESKNKNNNYGKKNNERLNIPKCTF